MRAPGRCLFGIAALIGLVPRGAAGSGFALDQTGRGAGSAFIGEAAIAEDGATLFYNPAGVTRLPGSWLSVAGQLVSFRAAFENHGSTINPALGRGRLRGTPEADGGEIGELADLFLTHQLSDRWWAGFAVTPPFGLATEYDHGWVGRYHALDSHLLTVDVAPTVAVKLLDTLSLGAGLDVQYAYANLNGDIDLGAACELNARRFGLPPSACGAVGLKPQSTDGFVRIRGDSWAVGYNLGFLWEPTSRTRLGLSYRSQMDQTIEGRAEFSVPKRAQILRKLSGALVDSDGSADLDLPDIVRFAVHHDLTPRWAIMTGVDWTRWSRFDELVFTFANKAQPPLAQPERWQDTLRTGLAVVYRPAERWRLRSGFAYDPTPVPNRFRRTPRIPDHDRYELGVGASFSLTDRLIADVGYTHIFSESSRVDNPDPLTGHVLRGSYSGSGEVFGGQVSWRFG